MNAAEDPADQTTPYAVVTVAYRSRSLLTAMLHRIPPPTPIIVVDNSADQESITDVAHIRPMTTYIDAGGNVGFGAACNLAARMAGQPLLVFVNPDADVDTVLLDELAREIAHNPDCSSCGPMLVDADGRVRAGSGGWLPTLRRAVVHAAGLSQVMPHAGISIGRATRSRVDVEWIAGTCLMVRRDVFLELGGFTSRYFLYQEDMDLGRRLRERGHRQILRCDLKVRHVAGTSSERQDVRQLAWLRASALVDYLYATSGPVTSRLTCAILAGGAALRAGYEIMRGRSGRLAELGTHASTMICPSRTLQKVHAQRQLRRDHAPRVRRQVGPVDG
jgi:N-acetylglucosaminyl-diphospho-decaprenol L-rhamnosyltransferase